MENLQERISKAANRTWQAIGGDILTAAEVDSMPREDVAEVVLDYIQQYGNDPEALAEFQKLSFEEKQAMLLKSFQFDHYGW